MIPNKKKVVRERRGRLKKIDNLLYHMRHEVKEEAKQSGQTEAKPVEAKPDKALPVQAPKKQTVKTIDAAAALELLGQLRQKLKIPDDKLLTWSYLEYKCVYHGIDINEMQKKALRTALENQAVSKPTP